MKRKIPTPITLQIMVHKDFPIQGFEEEQPIIDRRDAPKDLFDIHHRYKTFNQNESKQNSVYIENGHPDAKAYQTLRNFFEHLQWAANSNARFYSYDSRKESTEYWGPNLRVKGNADLFSPREWDEHVSHINSIELTPENTYINVGSWIVTTKNEYFFEALRTTAQQLGVNLSNITVTPSYSQQYQNWDQKDYFEATWHLKSIDQFFAVKQIIDDFADPLTKVPVEHPNKEV